jgi:carbonic anhydrase
MRVLTDLLANNQRWAERMVAEDPQFFERLVHLQTPKYLWIGCSDSRVPANQIVGLPPGALFVHRNVANVVVHTDLNCLSVMQFAIDVLKVEHIIVCGHYGCGGVKAVLDGDRHGLVDNWLQHVRDVLDFHTPQLEAVTAGTPRQDRLCELNVIEQVKHVCQTTFVNGAWERGQPLSIHGWIYGIKDGLLRDLDVCVTGAKELPEVYHAAIGRSPGTRSPGSPALG